MPRSARKRAQPFFRAIRGSFGAFRDANALDQQTQTGHDSMVIAMATKARIRFTYEDYKSLPYVERQRFELLEGELIPVTLSPGEAHQRSCGELAFHLRRFVKEHQAGRVYEAPFDVVLGAPGEEQVVQPDILFVSAERQQIIHPEEIRGAPDLVVEVLSPSTGEKDRVFKRRLYAKYGVREYRIVDPIFRAFHGSFCALRDAELVSPLNISDVPPQGGRSP